MSEIDFDVAIVGAGPAGASTALHLLARLPRAKIALIDKERLPREKPCGGALSRWGIAILEKISASPTDLDVAHVNIMGIRVRCAGHVAEHQIAEGGIPLGAVVRRSVFDAALAREAQRRGAHLFEGLRVTGLSDGGGRLELTVEDGRSCRSLTAKFIVGADGTGSAVRRLALFGEDSPRAQLIVLETPTLEVDNLQRPDGGVLEFDLSVMNDEFPGYTWHFATTIDGARRVSRGIFAWRGGSAGRPRSAHPTRPALEDALRVRGLWESPQSPHANMFKAYSERVFTLSAHPPARRNGILLVGEAAGLVDPTTGEGIAQAIASGKVAAEELAHALGDDTPAARGSTGSTRSTGGEIDPERYARALAECRWHRHLRASARVAPTAYGRHARKWSNVLATTPAAVVAGSCWYAGEQLSFWQKAETLAALGLSVARSFP